MLPPDMLVRGFSANASGLLVEEPCPTAIKLDKSREILRAKEALQDDRHWQFGS